jgi:hypothetical protein
VVPKKVSKIAKTKNKTNEIKRITSKELKKKISNLFLNSLYEYTKFMDYHARNCYFNDESNILFLCEFFKINQQMIPSTTMLNLILKKIIGVNTMENCWIFFLFMVFEKKFDLFSLSLMFNYYWNQSNWIKLKLLIFYTCNYLQFLLIENKEKGKISLLNNEVKLLLFTSNLFDIFSILVFHETKFKQLEPEFIFYYFIENYELFEYILLRNSKIQRIILKFIELYFSKQDASLLQSYIHSIILCNSRKKNASTLASSSKFKLIKFVQYKLKVVKNNSIL